ncbi:MAG: hypothetical protein K0R07_1998, partial [Sedimentibacter sp.]|nr:hypothetical protein [Sedimentibacter sp.]
RDKISAAARPYIYLMYDKEILQGDSSKNINPTSKITRAEISALLDKAYDYIEDNDVYPDLEDYVPTTAVEGIITKLSDDKAESFIYIKNNSDVESIVKINEDTEIYVNGRTREFGDLKLDMIVECKIDENRLAVKVEADTSKDIVKGIIKLIAYVEPAKITIYDEDNKKLVYDIPSGIDVYLDGKQNKTL